MEELIPISDNNGRKAVNARLLHAFLESKKDFSSWIKDRIQKYSFVENQDFEVFTNLGENPSGGRPLIEYALSLSCAKEIAMVEGNAKGKQARQYFIECERQSKEPSHVLPQSFSEALMLAAKQAEQLEKQQAALQSAQNQIDLQAPKVRFVDKVMFTAKQKIDIGEAAKILKLPYGRNTLFKELRERGIFFKEKNEPKQQYINQGYFELKEKEIQTDNHGSFIVIKVLVTQRGLFFLNKEFDGQKTDGQLANIQ